VFEIKRARFGEALKPRRDVHHPVDLLGSTITSRGSRRCETHSALGGVVSRLESRLDIDCAVNRLDHAANSASTLSPAELTKRP